MEQPFESPTSELPDSLDSASPLNVSNIDVIPVAAWRSSPAKETAEEHMDRDKSIIAQNAGTTAAAIYNAIIANSEVPSTGFDETLYDAIRLHVFNGTLELAGAGIVVEQFAAPVSQDEGRTYADNAGAPSAAHPQTGSGNNDHGAGIELKFGRYKGKTIAQVADEGEEGVGWLNWAATNSNNDFVKAKAREFLTANGLLEAA